MLRTIFSIGLFAVLGLIALKFIFGIFGLAVGLFIGLLVRRAEDRVRFARDLLHHSHRESGYCAQAARALVGTCRVGGTGDEGCGRRTEFGPPFF